MIREVILQFHIFQRSVHKQTGPDDRVHFPVWVGAVHSTAVEWVHLCQIWQQCLVDHQEWGLPWADSLTQDQRPCLIQWDLAVSETILYARNGVWWKMRTGVNPALVAQVGSSSCHPSPFKISQYMYDKFTD